MRLQPVKLSAVLLLGLSLCLTARAVQTSPPPYLDAKLTPQQRAADLLGRMTLEEKVGQMTQIDVTRLMGTGEWDRGPLNPEWLKIVLDENHVGSLLSGGGAAPVPNTPEAWATMTNDLQKYALEHSRLHVPILYGADAVHGHNNVLGATLFPHNLGLGATFDANLARQIGGVTGRAARATGVTWDFAPVADVGRDPRWGRFYETFGEDPTLAGAMVGESVRGLQGEKMGASSVAATLKHFIGYGAPQNGVDRAPALIPMRMLREVHLPPFKAGVQAGAASVMANSGSVNGVPGHASRELLTDVLRGDLGFEGVTISDWEDILRLQTVHHVAASYREAVKQALTAGVDVSMVPHDAAGFTGTVLDLVNGGELPQSQVDEAARRVLTLKFELGLFEHPYVDPGQAEAAVTAGKDLALRAARESMTLLKNDANLLPLGRNAQSVLLVGPRANDPRSQLGGWSVGWQGVPENEDAPAVTILDGMKAVVPKGVRLAYSPDLPDSSSKKTASADVLVVVVGEPPHAEGQADNGALSLPPADEALLRKAVASGKKVVAVLLAGRPIVLPGDVQDGLAALLMAYLPGSEGGRAVADVLYGNTNPGGRLPFTWPGSVAQLPLTYDALPGVKYEPLYGFGDGLSYTTFEEKNLKAQLAADGTVNLSVDVTNTGKVAGAHGVLAFVHGEASGIMRPARQLAAFGRVTLRPNETRTVSLSFPVSQLARVGGDISGMASASVMPGKYQVTVGGASASVQIP